MQLSKRELHFFVWYLRKQSVSKFLFIIPVFLLTSIFYKSKLTKSEQWELNFRRDN